MPQGVVSPTCRSDILETVAGKKSRSPWVPPERGNIGLQTYSKQWLEDKLNLRLRSREQHEINLRQHINPVLGDTDLSKITALQHLAVIRFLVGLLQAFQLRPSDRLSYL
ncbi:MAG: hypothetical protein ACP5O0_08895 [Acidimicrobiales bacterium]